MSRLADDMDFCIYCGADIPLDSKTAFRWNDEGLVCGWDCPGMEEPDAMEQAHNSREESL